MNPNGAHVVLDIDSIDRDPTLVDSPAGETRRDAALYRHHRKPACLIAHLDEKQHALAFEMRDLVGACVASC